MNKEDAKTYTKEQLMHAVNEALKTSAAGGSIDQTRQRMGQLVSGGYDFADTLHNVYLDFGYPQVLSFFNFWNMYKRFGIAARVVELLPDKGWKDTPTIESSEAVENDVDILVERFNLWQRMKGLDTRQRVGRYAGMFMRVRDGKQPSEPIEGTLSGIDSLSDMVPLYESQLKVLTTDDDPSSESFGMPKMYEFSGSALGSRSDQINSSFSIHPSRVVIAAEGADNGTIYGVPTLESIYNSLLDLRKVIGGGAEGFYKNSSQNIVFNLEDTHSASTSSEALDGFNEKYDEFAANRQRRSIWTPGMTAKTLESNLIEPGGFFTIALNDVAAGSGIPSTVLIGQQTGRLASDEDTSTMNENVQSRRENFQTEMTRNVIDWFMTFGILPTAEYEVEFPDAMAPSASDKVDNADKMASVNQKNFSSGGGIVFSDEELREAAGFDPDEAPEQPDETLTEEDEEDV